MTGKKDNDKSNDSSDSLPLQLALSEAEGWRGVGGDVNCDMGEGMANDELIMPFISSANIACGFHAGDQETMRRTTELAIKHYVAIGAHPSFFDRKNFGRTEIKMDNSEVYDLVIQQLILLNGIVTGQNARLHHVKPHGALYNMSARDAALANTIAKAVKDFDPSLIVYGLSGSHSIHEAKANGLQTASEVFADRTYRDDGSLTPRSEPNALIRDADKAVNQVLQMIKDGTVTSISGKIIPVVAETICIHGDGEQAVEFAKAIHEAFDKNNILISLPHRT